MSNIIKLGLIGISTPTVAAFMSDDFEALLAQADPDEAVILDMHSEGGSVLEGFRMGNFVGEYEGHTVARVNVAAFSIASYVAVRCNEVEIASNGFMMIHNPKAELEGDDEELATSSKLLTQMKASMIDAYVAKTGLPSETIKQMMKEETWLSADEAVKLGFADKIISVETTEKPQFTNTLPALVLACLRKGEGNQPAATPQELEMSITRPVAATVKSIKAAFPKAKSEFIVKCMEEEKTDEEVAAAHAKAMEDENEELKARLSAMEEEMTALKAKAMEEEEETAKAQEEEEKVARAIEEEEKVKAKARATLGLKPVAAKITQPITGNAREQWNELVDKYVAKGTPRIKAVLKANKARPDLREAVVAEANN